MPISPKIPCILFVANHVHFLNHYYLHLIDYLKAQGFQIGIIVPFNQGNNNLITGQDFTLHVLKYFNSYKNDSLNHFRMLAELREIITKSKPYAILTFTFKISIATALASWNLRIPLFPTLTGLGFLFTHQKMMAFISVLF